MQGKKLGGVLCETKVINNMIHQAVIGVGVNYRNVTVDDGINLEGLGDDRNLLDYHKEINLYRMVIFGILNSYQRYLEFGVEGIIPDYNQLLYNLNDRVTIEENRGIISGCDSQGNLQVKISALNASSKVSFSPEKYRISYEKTNGDYLITEL